MISQRYFSDAHTLADAILNALSDGRYGNHFSLPISGVGNDLKARWNTPSRPIIEGALSTLLGRALGNEFDPSTATDIVVLASFYSTHQMAHEVLEHLRTRRFETFEDRDLLVAILCAQFRHAEIRAGVFNLDYSGDLASFLPVIFVATVKCAPSSVTYVLSVIDKCQGEDPSCKIIDGQAVDLFDDELNVHDVCQIFVNLYDRKLFREFILKYICPSNRFKVIIPDLDTGDDGEHPVSVESTYLVDEKENKKEVLNIHKNFYGDFISCYSSSEIHVKSVLHEMFFKTSPLEE